MRQKYLFFALLSLIIIFSAFLRLGFINATPDSLDWDEVSIGYNAWSVSETGKDEYGNGFPVTFRSFDDYKPPLYIYLTAILFKIFGPHETLIRIPSAVLGILTVFGTYLLVSQVFRRRNIALFSSFFVACSPWLIHFSRVAFEGSSSLFFLIFGAYFFLRSQRRSVNYIFASIFFFGLGMYSYHSARVTIPLLVLGLLLLNKKFITSLSNKTKFLTVSMSIILITPLILSLFNGDAQKRYNATNIFSAKNINSLDPTRKLSDIENGQNLEAKIFHNYNFYHVEQYTKNYLSHFSPEFLFFTHDNPRHHVPGLGVLLIAELPFLLLGIKSLIKNKFDRKSKLFLLLLILISPLPSAATLESPHAVRGLILALPLHILSGIGISNIFMSRKLINRILVLLLGLLYLFNFYYFLHQYLSHFNTETSYVWQYGRKEAALISQNLENEFDEIWVSNKLEQSYVFWLFYQKISPSVYLSSGGTVEGYQGTSQNQYSKYRFKNIDIKSLPKNKKILLIGESGEFPIGQNIKHIYSPDNKPIIDFVSVSPQNI